MNENGRNGKKKEKISIVQRSVKICVNQGLIEVAILLFMHTIMEEKRQNDNNLKKHKKDYEISYTILKDFFSPHFFSEMDFGAFCKRVSNLIREIP